MADVVKSLVAILILSFISKGHSACSPNNIIVGTVRSGRVIQGKPEWNVQAINNCTCAQSDITVTCQGFQTVEPIPSSVFVRKGSNCILNGGRPLAGFASIKFSYAWDPPFLLRPVSSTVRC